MMLNNILGIIYIMNSYPSVTGIPTLSKDYFQRVSHIEAHNSLFNFDMVSLCEISLNDTTSIPQKLIDNLYVIIQGGHQTWKCPGDVLEMSWKYPGIYFCLEFVLLFSLPSMRDVHTLWFRFSASYCFVSAMLLPILLPSFWHKVLWSLIHF